MAGPNGDHLIRVDTSDPSVTIQSHPDAWKQLWEAPPELVRQAHQRPESDEGLHTQKATA